MRDQLLTFGKMVLHFLRKGGFLIAASTYAGSGLMGPSGALVGGVTGSLMVAAGWNSRLAALIPVMVVLLQNFHEHVGTERLRSIVAFLVNKIKRLFERTGVVETSLVEQALTPPAHMFRDPPQN